MSLANSMKVPFMTCEDMGALEWQQRRRSFRSILTFLVDCITLSYMQSVLTIRLDDALGNLLKKVCASSGRNRSDVVRDALRRQLEVATFDQLRARAMPIAESRGFFTDEDVFKVVS